jgi:hypothetical protein
VTTAWFHCFSGVSGDMTLGALLDAGVDLGVVVDGLRALALDGWSLHAERVLRGGISATRAIVDAPEQPHHRPYADIVAILDNATLPDRTRRRAAAAFRALAQVEAELHGVAVDHVEFHEVGSLDAIVDIVGSCLALEALDVDEVVCSPVALGLGTVRAAHGVLPNPAPATLRLLARAGAPARGIDQPLELATPTGVALMTTLASTFGPLPAMTVTATGHGAGGRDLPHQPNVVQVVLGEAAPERVAGNRGQPVTLLEANVDDVTGEVLAHTVAALLAAGAHDAWITPIVMKKGRPAHTVHALCDPSRADAIAATLLRETGTLGLRGTSLERWPQAREVEVVDVDGQPVRVKLSGHRVKVEFDDAAAAADALGRPVRDVIEDATRRGTPDPGSG